MTLCNDSCKHFQHCKYVEEVFSSKNIGCTPNEIGKEGPL